MGQALGRGVVVSGIGGAVGFVIAIKVCPCRAVVGRPAISLLVAILAGALFVRRQLRLPFPLLDFSIFRNAAFTSGVLAAVLLFAIGGVELATTQRFQLVAGFTPPAGMLVSAAALGSTTALLGGAFLHRIGLRILIAGGLAAGSRRSCLRHGASLMALADRRSGADRCRRRCNNGWHQRLLWAILCIAHRAGMASSVEEVSYEFGSLFAVTILGSLWPTSIRSTSCSPPEPRKRPATAWRRRWSCQRRRGPMVLSCVKRQESHSTTPIRSSCTWRRVFWPWVP